jgi:hypothetical protein
MSGIDEYPALTHLEYCAKDHWENGDEPYVDNPSKDPFVNCNDFKQQEQ